MSSLGGPTLKKNIYNVYSDNGCLLLNNNFKALHDSSKLDFRNGIIKSVHSREGIIVHLRWHIGRLNFTYLGNLRLSELVQFGCRSRRECWSRQGCRSRPLSTPAPSLFNCTCRCRRGSTLAPSSTCLSLSTLACLLWSCSR